MIPKKVGMTRNFILFKNNYCQSLTSVSQALYTKLSYMYKKSFRYPISKQNSFITSDGDEMVPMQILMDMMIDQSYWFNQKIMR